MMKSEIEVLKNVDISSIEMITMHLKCQALIIITREELRNILNDLSKGTTYEFAAINLKCSITPIIIFDIKKLFVLLDRLGKGIILSKEPRNKLAAQKIKG